MIKTDRSIDLRFFNMYDLEFPIYDNSGKVYSYESVCRFCGARLLTKKGKYNYRASYCHKNGHNGDRLFALFNWNQVAYFYVHKIQETQKTKIVEELNKINLPIESIEDVLCHFIICEQCNKLSTIHDLPRDWRYYLNGYKIKDKVFELKLKKINVHHKIPVHTLTKENILLIWDYSNLIVLCEDCHKKQDHQLAKRDIIKNIKKYITIERWIK